MKPTILYVDDEQFYMGGIVDYLSQFYTVVTQPSGDAALDYLAACVDKPDLIVLDIMMPTAMMARSKDRGRTAGIEFACVVLQPGGYNIPIVCYTVVTDPHHHEELLRIGVKQIVPKGSPLPVDLKAAIDVWIAAASAGTLEAM